MMSSMLGQPDDATGYRAMVSWYLLLSATTVVPALLVIRALRQRKRKRSREAMSTDDLRRKRLAKLGSTQETKGNTGGYNTDGASEKTVVEANSQEPLADRGPEKTMGVTMSEAGTSISPKRSGNVVTGTGEEARRAVKKDESWPESKKKGNTDGCNTDGAAENTVVAKSREPSADRGPEKTMGAATSETGTSTSAKRAGNVATETGTEARRAVDKAESWLESKKKGNTDGCDPDGATEQTVAAKSQKSSTDRGPEKTTGTTTSETGTSTSAKRVGNVGSETGAGAPRAIKKAEPGPESKKGNTDGCDPDGASEQTVATKSQKPAADCGPEKTMGAMTLETGTSTSAKRAGNVATGTEAGGHRAVKKAESWPESKKKEATADELDLPGGMKLDGLLEMLRLGPSTAFEAIAGVVSRSKGGGDKASHGRHADARGTPVDICRRWWNAAWRAGDVDAAAVAADAFFLHLSHIEEDLFTTVDEKRAVTLQAFFRASPHPAMVRRVLLGHPTAARSALRLALTPLQPNSGPSVPFVHALSTTSKKAEAELAARVIDSTHRMEAFQPLEGLESVERLLRSPAGAVALSTVLGFEARQDYVHGADFEANSCLGPLLIALPCVLPFKQHFRAASETLKETIAGASVGLPSNRVPVAHRLAKRAAELMALKTSHNAKPLARQFNAYLGQVSRNRQAFVELIQAALVKAMMTKGLADDAKSDVCSWLSKAISLHESLPQLCHQRAPELLGEPGTGSTSASSAFLMSLSALLLRLGSWKFINADEKTMNSIDPSYLEMGSVRFENGAQFASDAMDDDEGADNDGYRRQEEEEENNAEEKEARKQRGLRTLHDGEGGNRGADDGEAKEAAKGETGEANPVVSTDGDDGGGTARHLSAPRMTIFSPAADDGGTEGAESEAIKVNPNDSGQLSSATSTSSFGALDPEKKVGARRYSLATELFFLTHRALEVIVSSMRSREAEAQRIVDTHALNFIGASAVNGVKEDAAAGAVGDKVNPAVAAKRLMYKEIHDAVYFGWTVEGLGSEAVLGLSVKFANFTAHWLEYQMRRGLRNVANSSLPVGDATEVTSKAGGAFKRIPPALIETMGDSWMNAARRSHHGKFLSEREAANAARFCGRVIETGLGLSVPAQGKLAEVLDELIHSGERDVERAKRDPRIPGGQDSGGGRDFNVRRGRSGAFRGSMYWGAKRGYAGAIMDDEELRRTLPKQLMALHASVPSVEGLAAEMYLSSFKYRVRVCIGRIFLHLWSHPLGEPRRAILDLVRAAAEPISTTAIATVPTAPSSDASNLYAGSGANIFVARDFFTAVFDMLTYFIMDARDRLRDGVIEERSNGGLELHVGHPHWAKYSRERKQCSSGLTSMVIYNLQLLNTLCTEQEVLNLLREGKLGLRSAAILSVILQTLYGEEAADYAVANPTSWGLNKPHLGALACQLLGGLAGPGIHQTKAFATALKSADPDFDSNLLEAAAAAQGGKCLRGAVITRLVLALEAEEERKKARQAEDVARKAEGGNREKTPVTDDPFEGVLDEVDAGGKETLARAYGDALGDLVHTQVESLSPGHYFDRRREGATLTTPRKVASELMRKLPRMLPTPPHPDSTIFAILEEDALNFARFLISGPVGTPYEVGLFVFDVFLPHNYPADPPLVSMITGQGMVKFNANLYSDGKICLSLLGKETGASATTGNKWDPDKSSLWQVFASIQTQVMTKDPYYNEGGGRSNMRGQGTAETQKASADENARIMLETIRHAAVANLRNPPRGCEEVVRTHFSIVRNRVLQRCKEACEHAPNERTRKATRKASMELRVELDRLEKA